MKVNAFMTTDVRVIAYTDTEELIEEGFADRVAELMDQGLQVDFEAISGIISTDADIGGFRKGLKAWAEKKNKHLIYAQKSDIYILALVGKQVIGIATLCAEDDIAMSGARLGNVFVDPAFRRQGVAKMIVNYALELARFNDYAYLSLRVVANNEPAMALYEALGFSPVRVTMMQMLPKEGRDETTNVG